MRKAAVILLALSAFASWSCLREALPAEETEGYGCISLRLDSGNAIRLDTKTDAEDLEEGLRFKNVLVVLTNSDDVVVSKVYKSEGESSVTSDIILLDHLLPGNYHVYAYANIDATAWQKTGSDLISAQEQLVVADDDFDSFLNRELADLTTAGTDVPADPSTSMLLTGQATVPVGLSLVDAAVDLLRPVVRFKVTVNNNTPYPVKVNRLSFSHFNPDKAYLLDHRNASGVPAVPDGVTYRALPDFNSSAPEATVSAESEGTVYQTLLYENVSPNPYKVFASLTLDRSGEDLSNLHLNMGERPFDIVNLATLNQMDVGESVDIILINPRTTTRSGRLYYGIGDSGIAWESCGYDSYTKFFARAQAINNEDASFAYDGFSYTGWGQNNSGLTGWTGNSGDAVNKGNSFDYTGAKSRYFLSLTKRDTYYTLDGISTNAPSQTSIPKVRIVAGNKVANRFPNDLSASNLIQFVNDDSSDSNYGKYLKSDCIWSAANEAAATACKVSWEAEGSSRHDHQFIMFGQYCSGGMLKRILKENNKEVPLTYMARNEDINVVINVFYANQTGELEFEVDNSTWTNSAATVSSHTFN